MLGSSCLLQLRFPQRRVDVAKKLVSRNTCARARWQMAHCAWKPADGVHLVPCLSDANKAACACPVQCSSASSELQLVSARSMSA